jgi:DMSO reductase anchor subunit
MRPALSILFFTVVSGMGYGLWFLLGAGLALAPVRLGREPALLALTVGAAFAAAGLVASTLHLGQPRRAWRAFSQWRSSWLSREGIAASASFVPAAALGMLLWRGADAGALRAGGLALAVLAAATVTCTAKIYTSLKTIPAWRDALVLPGYLLLGLLGGSSAGWLIGALAHDAGDRPLPGLVATLALAAALLKRAYWRRLDRAPPAATAESATGLGRFGTVRAVEAPHTEENYLTREMGFALARKHAARLRRIALFLIGAVPAALGIAAALWPVPAAPSAGVVASAVIAGSFVERWLFFAEAKHVVMLFYGER